MKNCLIIDTVDRLFPQCIEATCPEPSEQPHGKGWGMIRKAWESVFNKIILRGMPTIFIAHTRDVKIIRKHREIDVTQPDLPKSGLSILHDMSDMILFMGPDDNDQPKLFGKPREDLMVGCRGGIEIDNAEPTYEAIAEAVEKATGKDFMELAPTVLVYGPPKIGKSTLAASFPNPWIVDTENGYKFLDVEKLWVCKTWEEFEEKFGEKKGEK